MIDVSRYERVAEYNKGELRLLVSDKKQVVLLFVIGGETYISKSFRLHQGVRLKRSELIHHESGRPAWEAFEKTHSFDVYLLEVSTAENLANRKEYYISTLHPTLNVKRGGSNRWDMIKDESPEIDFSQLNKICTYQDGKTIWHCNAQGSAVYLLKFNNDTYIGSTRNIRSRVLGHTSILRCGHCRSSRVQSAFNESKGFDVYILSQPPILELREEEHRYINALRPSLNAYRHVSTYLLDICVSETAK